MGVKSTFILTRSQAIKRAADIEEQKNRRAIEARFYVMSNKQLEDELERLNDSTYEDGEGGFENYLISNDPQT